MSEKAFKREVYTRITNKVKSFSLMFKHDSDSKESACDAGDPVLGGDDPLEEEMATYSRILA